ncbi:MAG: archaeosine biosynthesis radical SAM protein RaSEA [Promethearchaeota archaeon]
MKKNSNSSEYQHIFSERIKSIRQMALKKRKQNSSIDLNRPVSFWIKKDRLIHEIGKELTIILRTKGCSWSLGETGGCTMCGYVLDANIEDVNQNHIRNQLDYVLNNKTNEISEDNEKFSLKIFNSGSFFDEFEISEETRQYIYEKVASINNIKEFTIESRIEYINAENLKDLTEKLNGKYTEVAIGLETVNDYIRNFYINKGMRFEDFKKKLQICKDNGVGIKAYLLLKPPFLTETGAIDDCVNSIKKLIDLQVNTISINPLNIQRGTLAEYLWYQNKYRPPWFHSLFKVLRKSLTQEDLTKVRVISDPSGAGTKRGIHNCLQRECEKTAQTKLQQFVFSQELASLENSESECDCKRKYQLQKQFY